MLDLSVRDDSRIRYESLAWLLIFLGVAVRLWIRTPTDFWEDEFIAATHAMRPFWQVLIDTVRNDVHPPLYFLQLHAWSLLGQSDLWLTANSVFWSLIALASLWWTTKKLYGDRVALLATAVFAILPSPTYMADQLRMYAMLATLIIWAFYFAFISFGGEPRTRKNLFCLAFVLIAICNTHAIGAIAVFSNGIYALGLVLAQPREKRPIKIWLLIYGVSTICAAPWIVNGMMHDANLGELEGISGFLTATSSTAIGSIVYSNHSLRLAGAVLGLLIILLGLGTRRGRLLTLAFLLLPLALAVMAELLHKPLFKWNFFSTLAAPSIAIVAGLALQAHQSRIARLVSAGCIVAFLAIAIDVRLTVSESQGFRALASLIRANYKPGDFVYVPQPSIFGGMAWYLEGPHWGSPLVIAPPPSPQWRKVYDRLGPRLVGMLGLEPKSQILHGKNVTLLIGNNSADQAVGAARVWLVTVPRGDLKDGYPPPDLNGLRPQWSKRERLWTTLYAASPQEITEAR